MRAITAYWKIRRAYIEQRLPLSWCPTLRDIKALHKDMREAPFCAGRSYEDIVKSEVSP
jgi:hypothetical protein